MANRCKCPTDFYETFRQVELVPDLPESQIFTPDDFVLDGMCLEKKVFTQEGVTTNKCLNEIFKYSENLTTTIEKTETFGAFYLNLNSRNSTITDTCKKYMQARAYLFTQESICNFLSNFLKPIIFHRIN